MMSEFRTLSSGIAVTTIWVKFDPHCSVSTRTSTVPQTAGNYSAGQSLGAELALGL
jgi:hypothetical protein